MKIFTWIRFDAENRYLIISCEGNETSFTKKDVELIIVKCGCKGQKLLSKCGSEISSFYDKFIEDINFFLNT